VGPRGFPGTLVREGLGEQPLAKRLKESAVKKIVVKEGD